MICKNCGDNISGNFCQNCGQKSNTHRLDFKHFMEHDIIHGVLHLDKGLLFTLKEILKKPAQVALDYINGKRKPYYNFFYILLLISGLFILLTSFLEGKFEKLDTTDQEAFLTQLKYIKIYLFTYVPFYAASAWLLLRKLNYNFLEHCIIAVVATVSLCIVNLSGLGLMALLNWIGLESNMALTAINLISSIVMLFYPIWTYYGVAKSKYKKWNLFLRIALIIIIAQLLIALFVKILTIITV